MKNRKDKVHTLRHNLGFIRRIGEFITTKDVKTNAEQIKQWGKTIKQKVDESISIIEEMDNALGSVKVMPSIFDEVMKIDKENRENKRGIYAETENG